MATLDRLSALPDDIRHKIRALLHIDDSVRTSVLSSRWRRLCLTNPALNFSFSRRFAERNIISFVDHCLILSSPIPKLLSVRFPAEIPAALRRWLRFAADRDVEEVVIRPLNARCCAEIPRVLFECRSMSSLKLRNCLIRSVPLLAEEEKLKFLKTVVLAGADVGDDALNSILSLCPMIETLGLSRCRGLSRFVVFSLTLRSLTVTNCDSLNQFQVVWAPRLSRINYDGDISKVQLMDGMENLEEAAILCSRRPPSANCQQWKQFITALAHVKVLSVNSWFFEFLLKAEGESGNKIICQNLVELHWWTVRKTDDEFTEASLCCLISALEHCPVLELLCMHVDHHYKETGGHLCDHTDEALVVLDHREYDTPRKRSKADNLLPRLKRVRMIDFTCNKEEVQLLKFVLSKADQLESVVPYCDPVENELLADMHQVIGSLPKVSPRACVTLFDSEIPYYACPKFNPRWVFTMF